MLNQLQKLGKVLIFPIAVLPFAALLNRIGAIGLDATLFKPDSVGYWIGFIINAPGAAVFNNIAILFAIGVAFGLAKDNRGEAALVGALAFLILTAFLAEGGIASLMYKNVFRTLKLVDQQGNVNYYSRLLYVMKTVNHQTVVNYQLDTGVFGGITVGILSAVCYNKYKDMVLPPYLAFFGGRRFIPMVVGLLMFPIVFLFAAIWPWCQFGLSALGGWIGATKSAAPAAGVLYGVANRLLQPFGLHHIINIFLWFQLPISGKTLTDLNAVAGNWDAAGYSIVNGDINAFADGLVGAGIWQSGFFPLFLGGLPGAAAAMCYTAKKSRRKETFAFLSGVAFISFLTGIDEPLAFAFIFVAPLLWIVHALFTGLICGITIAFGIRLGFGFSAGFIDYALSFWRSWQFSHYSSYISWAPSWLANPLWIFPLSIGSFAMYFFSFSWLIKRYNFLTPGRDDAVITGKVTKSNQVTSQNSKQDKHERYRYMASEIIQAIALDNIVELGNCTTRLRMKLKDNQKIDEQRIKAAGAFNIIRLDKNSTQIVIGVDVEHVANAMQEIINNENQKHQIKIKY